MTEPAVTEPAQASRQRAFRGATPAGGAALGGHDSRGCGGSAGLARGGGALAPPGQEALAHIGDDHEDDLPDDLLVEEISIDGMCGVY
ncbi:MAG TPA: mycofactocin precursor MftA [Acidimicrobiales bacterium]|nr:mycofactocin precursor MftA [Acidimicrobiales bacterium]HLH46347.1 mycofactocin precursor MftA [Acidimicrobiales bacterium]